MINRAETFGNSEYSNTFVFQVKRIDIDSVSMLDKSCFCSEATSLNRVALFLNNGFLSLILRRTKNNRFKASSNFPSQFSLSVKNWIYFQATLLFKKLPRAVLQGNHRIVYAIKKECKIGLCGLTGQGMEKGAKIQGND
jgi:hypothetical protein